MLAWHYIIVDIILDPCWHDIVCWVDFSSILTWHHISVGMTLNQFWHDIVSMLTWHCTNVDMTLHNKWHHIASVLTWHFIRLKYCHSSFAVIVLFFALQDNHASVAKHLSILVEFIFAMQEKLRNINENSYNNFMLKIGKDPWTEIIAQIPMSHVINRHALMFFHVHVLRKQLTCY